MERLERLSGSLYKLELKIMSKLYKIEGENEFAYFNANFNQLRQIFESDPNWVGGVMELAEHYAISKGMQSFRNSLWGSKVEEQGNGYFEVRGTVSMYYRAEAVSDAVSRIIPIGKLPTVLKVVIPFQLALVCILPVVLTPLIYKLQKNKILWSSKAHIEPLCQYLQIQGQRLFGQGQKGARQQ